MLALFSTLRVRVSGAVLVLQTVESSFSEPLEFRLAGARVQL